VASLVDELLPSIKNVSIPRKKGVFVDFTPNPNRAHTRGFRGHGIKYRNMDGIGIEQSQFEDSQRENDRKSRFGLHKVLDQGKLNNEALNKFHLRGFRGHDTRLISKGIKESDGPMLNTHSLRIKHANAARVRAGTGGLSKHVRRLNPLIPHASIITTHGARHKFKNVKYYGVALKVKPIIDRFLKLGELPNYSPEELQAGDLTSVRSKDLKRLIQTLLVRAGVEQNPGPTIYEWSSSVVNTSSFVVNPAEFPPLPTVSNVALSKVEEKPKPEQVKNDKAFAAPKSIAQVELRSDLQIECRNSGRKVRGDHVNIKGKWYLICPCCSKQLTDVRDNYGRHPGMKDIESCDSSPAPDNDHHADDKDSKSSSKSPDKTNLDVKDTKPVKSPEVMQILDGFTFTKKQLASVMTEQSHMYINKHMIKIKDVVVPYSGEHRLVADRNVLEVKAPIRAVEVSMLWTENTWTRWIIEFLLFSIALILPFYTFSAYMIKCAIGYHASVGGTPMQALESMLNRSVNQAGFLCKPSASLYICLFLEIIDVTALVIALRRTKVTLSFIPHIVSSVVAEYSAGTNAQVVNSTIRQKILRLSCLPIPDYDAIAFISGSEIMAEFLLRQKSFFCRRAATFNRSLGQYRPPQ